MNARSLPTALHAVVAAVALVMVALPARADDPVDPKAKCTDSDAANASAPFFVNPSFVACTSNYGQGDAPDTTLPGQPFASYGYTKTFHFVGQTKDDGLDTGPFKPFGEGLTFGTLLLKDPLTKPFVIALASAGDYSLYLYDPATDRGLPVGSIEYSTNGTSNKLVLPGVSGPPFPLQYANLYTVPEPSSYALMLAGLSLTALALRRRKA